MHTGILGQHKHHKPHRTVGQVDGLSDDSSHSFDKTRKCCGLYLPAEDNRQQEYRDKQGGKANAIERWRIPEFDQARITCGIFEKCKQCAEYPDQGHNLRRIDIGTRQQNRGRHNHHQNKNAANKRA